MTQEKSPEVEQPEKKAVDLIPEERLKEILNILLPWGYSQKQNRYTGLSPYIGERINVITITANDTVFEIPFSICIDCFEEDSDARDSMGFYKGIMKLIAPELHSTDEKFQDTLNVLDFNLASDCVQDNAFPAKVIPKVFDV
jgi:hypothetical protein